VFLVFRIVFWFSESSELAVVLTLGGVWVAVYCCGATVAWFYNGAGANPVLR